MNGAQAVVACLKEQGVDTVFGYPGGMILPLYDALYDSKEIKQVLVTHEQNAAHAADGYARASGKVGVCIATSGPGGHESCDRSGHGLYGFHSGGGDYRTGGHGAIRPRCLSGNRYSLRDHADYQAQLQGKRCQNSGGHDKRSLCLGEKGPAWPCACGCAAGFVLLFIPDRPSNRCRDRTAAVRQHGQCRGETGTPGLSA